MFGMNIEKVVTALVAGLPEAKKVEFREKLMTSAESAIQLQIDMRTAHEKLDSILELIAINFPPIAETVDNVETTVEAIEDNTEKTLATIEKTEDSAIENGAM